MIPLITLKSGRKIPKLGLGTYMIGGGMKRDIYNDDLAQITSIKYAVDKGLTHIRTAQNYAEGHCEELIGKALMSYKREKIFITVAVNENFGIDEDSIVRELRGSLSRLNTSYVDLFLIGGVNPTVSLKSIAKGLLKVKQLGLAKDIGTSNYRLNELKYLNSLLDDQLVYNELQYNLIIREPELDGMKQYLMEENIVLGAYRPLQQGQLSKSGIELFDNIAKKYNRSNTQIALKWLVSQKNTVTIVKSTNHKHLDEIASVFDWEMNDDDIEILSKNFPMEIKKGDCMPPTPIFTK